MCRNIGIAEERMEGWEGRSSRGREVGKGKWLGEE